MSNKEIFWFATRATAITFSPFMVLLPLYILTEIFNGWVGICIGLPMGLFIGSVLLLKFGPEDVKKMLKGEL
jgi:hypothetical protein